MAKTDPKKAAELAAELAAEGFQYARGYNPQLARNLDRLRGKLVANK
ncbi:MAG: hypothetical protein ACYCX4_00455 [Bacillota bacterium]